MNYKYRQQIKQLRHERQELLASERRVEALNISRRIAEIEAAAFGSQHQQLRTHCDGICKEYIEEAIRLVRDKEHLKALELLRATESLQCSDQVRSQVMNNMACCLKLAGNFRTALSVLNEALKLDIQNENESEVETRLNLSVILSKLARHDQSYMRALEAIVTVQHTLLLEMLPAFDQQSISAQKQRFFDLAVGFHNAGTELQFLKRGEEARASYSRALHISKVCIKDNQKIRQKIEEKLKEFNECQKAGEARGKEKEKEKEKANVRVRRGVTGRAVRVYTHTSFSQAKGKKAFQILRSRGHSESQKGIRSRLKAEKQ